MDKQVNKTAGPSLGTYVTGFLLSIILTLVAYGLAQRYVSTHHSAISHGLLIFMILGFAFTQFLVQMVFFLHIDTESKPRFKQLTLLMAIVVVLIVVGGSVWIMHNLNYRMTPQQINQYMQDQAGSGL